MSGGRRLYRTEQTKYGQHSVRVADNLGFRAKDLDILHTTLDNDKTLVLEIVEECKNGNFDRISVLSKGGGLEWIRSYAVVSDKLWKSWKDKENNNKRKQLKAKKS